MIKLFSKTRVLLQQASLKKNSLSVVTMYSKEHCGLCTVLHERLEDLQEELEDEFEEEMNKNNNKTTRLITTKPRGFTIETVDITKNKELYERYKFTIPVLFIDGVCWKEEVTLDRFERSIHDFVQHLRNDATLNGETKQ